MNAYQENITARREHESATRRQVYKDFWQVSNEETEAYARHLQASVVKVSELCAKVKEYEGVP